MRAEFPLLTIVVPVYKVPYDMLRRCLKSIEVQTSDNYEVILIDDGSPDDCGKICDEFAEGKPFVRVIHQQNGGLAVVRNNGVDNAKGQWVCFVDGDDWIEPETIAFAEGFIKANEDADLLIWDEYCYTKDSKKANHFLGRQVEGTIVFGSENRKELFDIMLPEKYKASNPLIYADIGNCHARAYKVAFLRSNNLRNQPEVRRMQDNVFSLWVFEKASKIVYQCKRLYHYSYNEEAATKIYNSKICDNFEMVYKYMMEFAMKCHPEESFRQRIYTRFSRLFLKIVEQKHANPLNPLSFRERIIQMKDDFGKPWFGEIISSVDLKGQAMRVRLPIICLRARAFIPLYLLVKVIVFSRSLRMRLR